MRWRYLNRMDMPDRRTKQVWLQALIPLLYYAHV